MKANGVPEKLYLHPTAKGNVGASWLIFPITNEDIEYTRTDAFIEKACKFLSNEANIPLWEGYNDTFGCDTSKLVDNFRKYMEE